MQDLEKFKNEMNLSGKNVYVGNRYAPVLDDGGWDNTKEYEPLTIIQYEGDSYISRTYVPKNVDINNKDYWYSIGVYNAQVASYRKRVEEVEGQLTAVDNKIDTTGVNLTNLIYHNSSNIVNIKEVFGATGNGVDSDVSAIQQAVDSGYTIGFPNGVYVIDEFIEFINKDIHWVALGNDVTLLDTGKEVEFEIGLRTISNGIKFTNCTVKIEGITHDTVINGSGEVKYGEFNYTQLKPKIDFINCGDVKLVDFKVKGQVGVHISEVLENDTISNPVFENMNCFYIRVYNSNEVTFENYNQLEGAGGGEFIGLNKCDNVKLIDSKHYQGDSSTTFWSFAKIIDCQQVTVNGVNVQSQSQGSLMDVSANQLVYENLNINYPNGKTIDITQEWGQGNIDSGVFKIRDSIINSPTLAFNSVGNGVNLKTVDHVEIDNVTFPKSLNSSPSISLPLTKNILIKNQFIYNQNLPCALYLAPENEHVFNDKIKNIQLTYDHVEILSDTPQYYNTVAVETKGLTKINNSVIETKENKIELRDRITSLTSNLKPDEKIRVEVNNTVFRNTTVYVMANTTFNNCLFINCTFEFGSYTFKPVIKFNDCEIKLEKESPLTSGQVFLMRSPSEVYFNNVDIYGTHYNTNGYPLMNVGTLSEIDLIELNNVSVNVVRYNKDNTIVSVSTGLFALNNTGGTITDLVLNKVNSKYNRLVTFNGTETSDITKKVTVKNSNDVGSRLTSFAGNFTNFDSYKVIFIGNNFGNDENEPSTIESYKTKLETVGAEVYFDGNYKI